MASCYSNALAWPWTPRSPSVKQKKQQTQPPIIVMPQIPIIDKSSVPPSSSAIPQTDKEYGSRHGANMWLPEAPFIPRPKAQYNAATLAYLGDCIYELYVRCHFLSPPQAIDKYNTLVMGLVCCEAQDSFLKFLLKDDFLSEEERDIVRWGKNVQTNHKKATKRAGAAVYSSASSLETLIGFLYLTNPQRLQEVMLKLGLTWTVDINNGSIQPENNPADSSGGDANIK